MMWQQDLSEMESSSENIVDTQSSSSSGHSALLLPASPKSLLVPTYEDQQKWQEAEKKAADKDEGRSCNSYGHKAAEWYQVSSPPPPKWDCMFLHSVCKLISSRNRPQVVIFQLFVSCGNSQIDLTLGITVTRGR